MGRTILFSPVGGTDPISQDNGSDGSLLHICRTYMPDEVILYMSQEVLEKQEKDDRYRRALRKLAEFQKRVPIIVKEVHRPELRFVQEFDYFYNDFHSILLDIRRSLDSSDILLINVSSGTPAMKSGLLVLQSMIDYHARMIQVVTPTGKMTNHTHDDGKNKKDVYDLDFLWEIDDDNRPDYINRCKEITCPSFALLKNEEIIKKHLTVYDYQAALAVAESMPSEATVAYYPLIQMGYYRTLLDAAHVDDLIKQTRYNCLPIQGENGRKEFEYALNLSLKYKRKQYADFILSITPIIINMFERILKKQAGFELGDYCSEKKNGEKRWKESKLNASPYRVILDQYYLNKSGRVFSAGIVYSDALNVLIQSLCKHEEVKRCCADLRTAEERVRNITAHQVVMVDEGVIKNSTGFTGKEILEKLQTLFVYTDIPVREEYWSSYEDLNDEIIRRIEKK